MPSPQISPSPSISSLVNIKESPLPSPEHRIEVETPAHNTFELQEKLLSELEKSCREMNVALSFFGRADYLMLLIRNYTSFPSRIIDTIAVLSPMIECAIFILIASAILLTTHTFFPLLLGSIIMLLGVFFLVRGVLSIIHFSKIKNLPAEKLPFNESRNDVFKKLNSYLNNRSSFKQDRVYFVKSDTPKKLEEKVDYIIVQYNVRSNISLYSPERITLSTRSVENRYKNVSKFFRTFCEDIEQVESNIRFLCEEFIPKEREVIESLKNSLPPPQSTE